MGVTSGSTSMWYSGPGKHPRVIRGKMRRLSKYSTLAQPGIRE